MVWIVFFSLTWLLALALVPLKQWRRMWPAGLAGLAALYAIDKTLIGLGAYYYPHGNPVLAGLPTLYWISSFPAGILVAYYYPARNWLRLPYVLFASAAFLGLEMIMIWLGYFQHLQWSPGHSYLLNVGGFIVVLWLAGWAGAVGKAGKETR